MRGLPVSFIFIVLLSLCFDSSAAPRKRRATTAKPTLSWVKDNSKLFTTQQAANLNQKIENLKDSIKALSPIYVVTQNNYSISSPFFKALKSSVADDKWYLSESKEYADAFMILIRPRSKVFTTPQLNILCNRNSAAIVPFLSSVKIDRLQNEYAKYLSDTPNTAQIEVITKLIEELSSRFFDGQVRDYNNLISTQDKTQIEQLIKSFRDSTGIKVAMVTTRNSGGEDSAFGRTLMSKTGDSKDEQSEMTVEYKNLNADIVFAFYPKGVYLFSSLDKEKLSDKAIQNLISSITQPQAKSGKYRNAMQMSLATLSKHLNGEEPLDGMSIWQKLGAALLGVGIPSVFGWLIFIDSSKKKKARSTSTSKPVVSKPVAEKKTVSSQQSKPSPKPKPEPKPEKKEDKINSKPLDHTTPEIPNRKLPSLKLTKPIEDGEDRGWTLDNTGSLSVMMSRIDDLFKPISTRNGHEKIMLEMIDYMRLLREYTDQEIAHSLGNVGVSRYLDELYECVDPAAVRIVFSRGLDLLIKNYAERDSRVSKYVSTSRK